MTLPLEKVPAHSWNHAEHGFLVVLWRWFERDPKNFAPIFNKAFGLNIKSRVVCARLENQLRLYGEQAFPVYGAVHSVPFDDPGHVYENVRIMILHIASMLDIRVNQLREEVDSPPPGKARTATAASTRREFKRLIRKTLKGEPAAWRPVRNQMSMVRPLIGGFTLQARPEMYDFEELSDTEPMTDLRDTVHQGTSGDARLGLHLTWRVFDDRSWTSWSEAEGFISGANVLRARPFPLLPPRPELERHAATHFSRDGGEPSFVSVFASLLQSLSKASNLHKPRLALVDLCHPTLIGERLHAAELLRSLKARGECRFARYRGHCEFLVWANLPRAAVIHEFSLVDLIRLYEHDEEVAAILNLDIFTARTPTKDVANILRAKRTTINATTGAVMGRIAALMFGPSTYDLKHITDLVARLVDGWSIKVTEPQHTEASALAFATHLGSRTYSKEDVAQAFLRGVSDGVKTLEIFENRCKNSRRHRK